jgi:glucosamine--fructose-6-phosphate aminotransferase (isomerizing)
MNLAGTAVVGISQSGASPDVVNVLRAGREQGRPTIAITNDVDSPMADVADVVVPLLVGEEKAVPSTKTFLACLQSVMQIEENVAPDAARSALIDRLPTMVAATIESSFQNPDLLSVPHEDRSLTVIGRGTGYAAACEIALKIREVSGITAESFSAPEYLHGPISGNGVDSTVWIIASPDQEQSYWTSLATDLEQRGCQVSTLWPSQLLPTNSIGMKLVDPIPAWIFAILATVTGQVVALLTGEKLGRDVDAPKGLLKITRTL